ncbi:MULTISPECIES: hypothetical protein [unclassified Nocardioides]|uniref:hypothetical protein n=1 Tax=unclassified Nocardioides TaxID=2615069 RepID=UPI0030146CA1
MLLDISKSTIIKHDPQAWTVVGLCPGCRVWTLTYEHHLNPDDDLPHVQPAARAVMAHANVCARFAAYIARKRDPIL